MSAQSVVGRTASAASARSLVPLISLLVSCASRCPESAPPKPALQLASSQPSAAPAVVPPPVETAAAIASAEPPSHGGLSREQVRGVVIANASGFQACYEAVLATNLSAQGGVTITFTVAPDGGIKEAFISSSSVGNPKMEDCMLKEFKGLRFPAAQKQTNASFPFVFKGVQR